MQIKILDSIECEVSSTDGELLLDCLSFESSYWIDSPKGKRKKVYQKNVFSFRGKYVCRFYTGLLPRVLKWCKDNNIEVNVVGEEIKIPRQQEPFLKGITLRDYQLDAINACCKHQRGVVHAATGIGKTIIQLGFISCFPKNNALILTHSVDISKQTFEKLKEFGFKSIELYGGGNSAKKPSKKIAVATIQTFIKIKPEYYMDYYDIILIDEAHHVQSVKSTYTTILKSMLAPIRIGFTGTKRTTQEAILVNEGLLGETIKRMTVHQAADLGVLAKPKLKFIKAKCNSDIMEIRKFQDTLEKIRINGKITNGDRIAVGVYTYGIVQNERRNKQIIDIVKDFYNKNETILVFVTKLEHGNILVDKFKKELNINVPFVQGSMDLELREKVKKNIIKKKTKIAIATTTWSEGVDIQNLDAVLIASGGKSEIQTLQRLGRGLRKSEGKEFVTIIDFLDLSHFHLIRQTGERLATYSDQNWL